MGKVQRITALISVMFFLYGCAAVLLGVGAGVGIGAYKFIEGRLAREYPIAYGKAWDATNGALTNLKISVSSSIDEGETGKIDAVQKDGTKVSIKIRDRGQGVSSISIRVGILGDKGMAEIIHDEIASVSGIT